MRRHGDASFDSKLQRTTTVNKLSGRKPGRRSLEELAKSGQLIAYVLRNYVIDKEWKEAILDGRASVRIGGYGVVICSEAGCFQLIRRLGALSRTSLEILAYLAKRATYPKTVAQQLGLDYQKVKNIIYFFYRIGLLKKTPPGFTLNDKHPQYHAILKLIEEQCAEQESSCNRVSEPVESCQATDRGSSSCSRTTLADLVRAGDIDGIARRIVEKASALVGLGKEEKMVLEAIAKRCATIMLENMKSGYIRFELGNYSQLCTMLRLDPELCGENGEKLKQIVDYLANTRLIWRTDDPKNGVTVVRIDKSLLPDLRKYL